MHLFKHDLTISSNASLVDITPIITNDITTSKIQNGIVIVYCPHTTAGITINENADPAVTKDILYGLEKAYPTNDPNYMHYEGNSHAHLKTCTVGASQSLIISNGNLLLGTWQNVYFCEFDGPRKRIFYVKIIEG